MKKSLLPTVLAFIIAIVLTFVLTGSFFRGDLHSKDVQIAAQNAKILSYAKSVHLCVPDTLLKQKKLSPAKRLAWLEYNRTKDSLAAIYDSLLSKALSNKNSADIAAAKVKERSDGEIDEKYYPLKNELMMSYAKTDEFKKLASDPDIIKIQYIYPASTDSYWNMTLECSKPEKGRHAAKCPPGLKETVRLTNELAATEEKEKASVAKTFEKAQLAALDRYNAIMQKAAAERDAKIAAALAYVGAVE